MTTETPDDIERRLNAGEWLRLTPLAVLFGVDRSTVHRWVTRLRLVRFRQEGFGSHAPIACNPEDVKALLARHRRIQGGEAAPGGKPPAGEV